MKKLLIICLACMAAALPVSAQTVSYNLDAAPLFSVDMPDGWKFEAKPSKRDPGTKRISGTGGESGLVWFGVWVVKDAKTIDEAVTYVKSAAKSLITDSKEKKPPVDGQINGLKARHFELSGTMNMEKLPEKFDARIVLFEVAPARVGIAVCMADTAGLQSEKTNIDAFFKSIRSAR